jgi:WD40 repeat protein
MLKVLQTFESEHYYTTSDSSLVGVSPQGRYAALGSKNGKVIILDLEKEGATDTVFEKKHACAVVSVDWSRRTSKVASIDSKGTVIVWN